MKWILAYWIATTIYGVYWLIKHPSVRHGDDMDSFTLGDVAACIFPAGLLAWAIVPMMIFESIKFKRPKHGK
jgi:hypothetical protein